MFLLNKCFTRNYCTYFDFFTTTSFTTEIIFWNCIIFVYEFFILASEFSPTCPTVEASWAKLVYNYTQNETTPFGASADVLFPNSVGENTLATMCKTRKKKCLVILTHKIVPKIIFLYFAIHAICGFQMIIISALWRLPIILKIPQIFYVSWGYWVIEASWPNSDI